MSTPLPAATRPLLHAAVGAPGRPADPAALRRTAQAFEAQALGALLQPMFAGLDGKGPFGGGHGEEQWRPMLVDAVGRDMARIGGVGIGDAVLRELTRLAGEADQTVHGAGSGASPTPSQETRTP